MENYTLVELRQMAKEKGIKNVSKLKKEDLLSLLFSNNSNDESNKTDEVNIKNTYTENKNNSENIEKDDVQLNKNQKENSA